MDVVEVCLSEVDTVCYGVVQSCAQEVATGASVYKWPGQNYTHKAIVSLFPCYKNGLSSYLYTIHAYKDKVVEQPKQ